MTEHQKGQEPFKLMGSTGQEKIGIYYPKLKITLKMNYLKIITLLGFMLFQGVKLIFFSVG